MKILFFNNIIGSALNIAMTMSLVSFEKSRSRQLTTVVADYEFVF